jgi:hypothetical protein
MRLDLSRVPVVNRDRVLSFERRAWERVARVGGAMAAFYDEDGAVCLTRVELVDASVSGLGLRCPMAIAPGTRFSLFAGGLPLPHVSGVVVRCEVESAQWCPADRDTLESERRMRIGADDPEGDGVAFRVGLRCDSRVAAA